MLCFREACLRIYRRASCCHPCINTSTLKLRMADAVDVLIPALAHAPTYVDLPVCAPEA